VFERCLVRISAGTVNIPRFFMVFLGPSRPCQESTLHQAMTSSLNILLIHYSLPSNHLKVCCMGYSYQC
jgi:hypothetical protein